MKFYDLRKNLKSILVIVAVLCGVVVGLRPWANRSSFATTSREVAIVGCDQTIVFKAFSGSTNVPVPNGGCAEALAELLTAGFTLQSVNAITLPSANANPVNANIEYLLIR